MKKIIGLVLLCLTLVGCGEDSGFDNNNLDGSDGNKVLEITLNDYVWSFQLPPNWETVPPYPEQGIVFLARQGAQNLTISNEEGVSKNIMERLAKTVAENTPFYQEIEKTEDTLIFRGKFSSDTTLREFHEKVILVPETDNFLLINCSQEVKNLPQINCEEILNSFYLKENPAKSAK